MNTTLFSTPLGVVSCGLDLGYLLVGLAAYRQHDYVQAADFLVVRLHLGPAWIAAAFRL